MFSNEGFTLAVSIEPRLEEEKLKVFTCHGLSALDNARHLVINSKHL